MSDVPPIAHRPSPDDPAADYDAYARWRRREQIKRITAYVFGILCLVALIVGVALAIREAPGDFATEAQKVESRGDLHPR